MSTHQPPRPAVNLILIFTVFAYFLVLGLYFRLHEEAPLPLVYSPTGLQNVAQTMGPLVAISVFIERAVELVIATSRGPGTLARQRALESAIRACEARTTLAAQQEVDRYKLQTQRCSFGVSLTLSLAASLVGVRAVAPLLAPSPARIQSFDLFDVVLTSLLLAGGSDGIHQVVITITTFLTENRKNSRKNDKDDGPCPP